MRTTIDLPDDLLRRAKATAALTPANVQPPGGVFLEVDLLMIARIRLSREPARTIATAGLV